MSAQQGKKPKKDRRDELLNRLDEMQKDMKALQENIAEGIDTDEVKSQFLISLVTE